MSTSKIKAHPSHVVKIDEGVLVSRGLVSFKLAGKDIHPIIQKILHLTNNTGVSKSELVTQFDEISSTAIENLIELLLERRILYYTSDKNPNQPPITENPEHIFYWHFDSAHFQRKSLDNISLLLAGNSMLSKHLLDMLKIAGFKKITLIDDSLPNSFSLELDKNQTNSNSPALLDNKQEQYDCLIATSDTNSTATLSFWNKISLERNWNYLPIALNNIHGYIGPYIIPRITSCFECLVARENSNLTSLELRRNTDSRRSINGFHPVMPAILAGLASMELVKFFTDIYTENIGKLITINFITQEMQSRKVLRVPHCRFCSAMIYA